jgi:mRNA-degrading endonuclease toxin of MazEF toxin-antitoxin module
VRRGEVYDYLDPYRGERGRVVLLAADQHTRAAPLAATIVRNGVDAAPYSIPLVEVDPISGYVLLVSLSELARAGLSDGPVCTLTGATMARIDSALRDLLDL